VPLISNLSLLSRPYPYFLFFSLYDIFAKKNYSSLDWKIYSFSLFFLILCLFHQIFFSSFSFNYLVAYIAPFFLLNYFQNFTEKDFNLISKYMTFFFIFLAFFQAFFSNSIINDSINLLFNVNFQDELGFRGVSGIYEEPSQFGRYFFLTFIIYFLTEKNRNTLYFIAIFVVFLLLNRSATLLLLCLVFIFFLSLLKKPITLFFVIFLFIFLSPQIYELIKLMDIRAFQPIEVGLEYILTNEAINYYDLISLGGGRRFLQNIAAIEMLTSNPLGNGLGSVDEKFLKDFIENDYIKYIDRYEFVLGDPTFIYDKNQVIKPFSYILQITYDFGYLFLIPLGYFFYNYFKGIKFESPIHLSLMCLAFFQLFFFSKLSLYDPWIIFGFLSIYKKSN
tara:strand:+ start:2161 stop:3336 length:1176 start_codon:yes stop_codon:yes gene_type:complete